MPKSLIQPNGEPVGPIAEFCNNIMGLTNGAHTQIAEFMKHQSIEDRARFLERCSSMASAVAETMIN